MDANAKKRLRILCAVLCGVAVAYVLNVLSPLPWTPPSRTRSAGESANVLLLAIQKNDVGMAQGLLPSLDYILESGRGISNPLNAYDTRPRVLQEARDRGDWLIDEFRGSDARRIRQRMKDLLSQDVRFVRAEGERRGLVWDKACVSVTMHPACSEEPCPLLLEISDGNAKLTLEVMFLGGGAIDSDIYIRPGYSKEEMMWIGWLFNHWCRGAEGEDKATMALSILLRHSPRKKEIDYYTPFRSLDHFTSEKDYAKRVWRFEKVGTGKTHAVQFHFNEDERLGEVVLDGERIDPSKHPLEGIPDQGEDRASTGPPNQQSGACKAKNAPE